MNCQHICGAPEGESENEPGGIRVGFDLCKEHHGQRRVLELLDGEARREAIRAPFREVVRCEACQALFPPPGALVQEGAKETPCET